ncbi:MAG TPA: calcium/proton exchanger [Armatimonadota bacterium]|nr:calcium/proton exchanger [Armatimonadota bacterium]
MGKLNWLLIFILVSILAKAAHAAPVLVFFSACLAIIPLAGLMGKATEELSVHLGPGLGGLLNATFGNAAELIITIFAIRQGLLEVVKASITGSIIGNILLVLGLSVLAGGTRYRTQKFNSRAAGNHATRLIMAVIGLLVPALFVHASPGLNPSAENTPVEFLSLSVAAILILVYLAGLAFSFITHKDLFGETEAGEEPSSVWAPRVALAVLVVATLFTALESEILVGSVEAVVKTLGVTELFIGVIVVPIIGNAAEHGTALMMAMRDKMDLTLNIAIGSSIQIALFVAPLLVFISLFLGHPMTYIFNQFELVSIGSAVVIANFISQDGESNWLEGVHLLAAYLIIALAFFFIPMH